MRAPGPFLAPPRSEVVLSYGTGISTALASSRPLFSAGSARKFGGIQGRCSVSDTGAIRRTGIQSSALLPHLVSPLLGVQPLQPPV